MLSPPRAEPDLVRPGSALSPPVETRALARSFGKRRAVDGVDLTLRAGETLALFGPNGAGKTTLLKLIAGLLRPTAGEARIAGQNVAAHPAARTGVGVISHHTLLYGALTARENVEFAARLYSLRNPREAAASALRRLGVDELGDRPVRLLSRGQQQRVSLARGIVHSPAVLLLDEPYSGLDAEGAAMLTQVLSELREAGATMIIVTHNLTEGLEVATKVAIMRDGRIVRMDGRSTLDAASYAMEYRELAMSGG